MSPKVVKNLAQKRHRFGIFFDFQEPVEPPISVPASADFTDISMYPVAAVPGMFAHNFTLQGVHGGGHLKRELMAVLPKQQASLKLAQKRRKAADTKDK